jgi:hypothetical protein
MENYHATCGEARPRTCRADAVVVHDGASTLQISNYRSQISDPKKTHHAPACLFYSFSLRRGEFFLTGGVGLGAHSPNYLLTRRSPRVPRLVSIVRASNEHRQTELVRPGAHIIDLGDGITPILVLSRAAFREHKRPFGQTVLHEAVGRRADRRRDPLLFFCYSHVPCLPP